MFLEPVWQYGIVGLAIAGLVGLKAYALRKRVSKQVEAYVDPKLCIQQLQKQLERVDLAQKMLQTYIQNSEKSPDRFRNIAMLVAFINSKPIKPKKTPQLQQLIKSYDGLKGVPGQYRDYIVKNTQKWQ